MEEFCLQEEDNFKRKCAIHLPIVILIGVVLYYLLGDLRQTMAATVFIALIMATLVFWRYRVAIAFIGIVVLMMTKTIDLKSTIEFMNLDVILFLMGMMTIIALLRRSGFFRWFLAKGLEFSKFRPHRLLFIIHVVSAFMAAMVDEVTSILFAIALVFDFCDYFKINPVKLTISIILVTNIGSSWTVLGNPIGILIALRSGLTFEDFLRTAFPVGAVAFLVLMGLLFFWLKDIIKNLQTSIDAASIADRRAFLKELTTIEDRPLFLGSASIFGGVILLLALHHRFEIFLGLEHNTVLVAAAILGSGICMLWKRELARELLMNDVDWWTLVFFMFLFAKAGTLQYVGLTTIISEQMLNLAGDGNLLVLIPLVLWVTGITSAAADNVVIVATFIPVMKYLSQYLNTDILWWALLFGGCYGGNMTMVGSTANIVALGLLEEHAGYHMRLRYWIKIGFWAAVLPMIIATVVLMVMVL